MKIIPGEVKVSSRRVQSDSREKELVQGEGKAIVGHRVLEE